MTDLSVTLQRPTRLAVDVDDDSIGVTRKVDAGIDFDLGHLLVNLSLRARRALASEVEQ